MSQETEAWFQLKAPLVGPGQRAPLKNRWRSGLLRAPRLVSDRHSWPLQDIPLKMFECFPDLRTAAAVCVCARLQHGTTD